MPHFLRKLRVLTPLAAACFLFAVAGSARASDAAARPSADGDCSQFRGKPLFVGLYLTDIYDLDVKLGTFRAKFYLWMQHETVSDAASLAVLEHIEFVNGQAMDRDELERRTLGADTYVVTHFDGQFRFRPSLEQYPFDQQLLEVSIEHTRCEEGDVRFIVQSPSHGAQPGPVRVGRQDSIFLPEYAISTPTIRVTHRVYDTDWGVARAAGATDSTYSTVVVEMPIRRLSARYFFKIIMPLLIILGMAFLIFWIPGEEVQSSTALATTALLACIAFNITIGQGLPDVGYLIAADKLFIVSYLVLFLTLVESVATYRLVLAGRQELALRIDKASRWLFPGLTASLFALVLVPCFVR